MCVPVSTAVQGAHLTPEQAVARRAFPAANVVAVSSTGAHAEATDADGPEGGRDLRGLRGASGGRPKPVDRAGASLLRT